MISRFLIIFAIACSCCFLLCGPARADVSAHAEPTPATEARPQIIKISAKGATPANLTMQRSDSVIFFYNTSPEDLLTLEIDFGKSSVHCSGALRVVKKPGLSRTRKPFGPKEFVSTCFHESGIYPYRIFSSLNKNRIYSGAITVQ